MRREVASARAAWQRGDSEYATIWSFEPRNQRQVQTVLAAVGEIIAAVEREGWVHVDTTQLFGQVGLHFERG